MQPPQPRQHSDIQMLQRQIMFKQRQEMQRKQQLHDYGDSRQQNYVNQSSLLNKQGFGSQMPSLMKGTPVSDAYQVHLGRHHLMQHGASPVIQGFPHGIVFPPAHATSSVDVIPQQLALSLYGTPIAMGNTFNQYTQIQAASHNFDNMLTRGSNTHMEIPIIQSSASNSFISEQSNSSFDQSYFANGASVPKHVFQDKNLHAQVSPSGGEVLPGNFQQVNTLQTVGMMQESGQGQGEVGWSGHAPLGTLEHDPTHRTSSLDPLEEKILFNTDDNGWEASLGGQNDMGAGGFDRDANADCNIFSSIQSGSWSALMQSAVAEAASSDTGAQEEWSGLSFQNPEPSTDIQAYIDSGKQQNNWVDNNLQNVSSPSSRPQLHFHGLQTNDSFVGFHQLNDQTLKQRDGVCSDSSYESVQQSSQNNKWSDHYPSQKHWDEESNPVQVPSPLEKNLSMHHNEHSGSGARQWSISSSTNVGQPCNSPTGYDQQGKVRVPEPVPWSSVFSFNETSNQGLLQNSKASEGAQHRSSVVSNSVFNETSAALESQCVEALSGEKMLDLLNKDDEPLEYGNGVQVGCRDSIPLHEVPQPEPDASVAHSYNSFSKSRSFGSPQGTSTQKEPKSQSSIPLVESSSARFTSGPMYLDSQLQNQQLFVAPGPGQSPLARGHELANRYLGSGGNSEVVSNQTFLNPCGQEFPALETMSCSHPLEVQSVSQQLMASNLWSNLNMQPSVSHSAPYSAPSNSLPSPDSASSSLQNPAGTSQYHHKQISFREGNNFQRTAAFSENFQQEPRKEITHDPSASGMHAVSRNQLLAPGQDVAKHFSDVDAATSCAIMTSRHQQSVPNVPTTDIQNQSVSAGELEAFGRSLGPSHSLQPNSRIHQVPSLKTIEDFPCGSRSAIDISPTGSNLSLMSQFNSSASGDNKLLSCASETGRDQAAKALSHSTLLGIQQMEMFNQNDTGSGKEKMQISAQMAASWFKHYGTLRNGQMMPMHDTRAMKNAVQHVSVDKSAQNMHSLFLMNSADTSQGSSIWPTTATTSVASTLLSPLQLLPQDVAVQRPRKRKIGALNLLAFHKEMTHPLKLQNISLAESRWAFTTNRLKEKLEDAEVADHVVPISRAKRRLVLTTNLMQLVFQPAPRSIMLAEASSNCKNIAYFTARSALGEACSLTFGTDVPFDSRKMQPDKLERPERPQMQNFIKIMEDLISRAKSLECGLIRMQRTPTFTDMRLESQELEKFSIINRLAKFHSRGHSAAIDAASLSGSSATILKTFPQRYVVAFPMPRTVPERVNCFPL